MLSQLLIAEVGKKIPVHAGHFFELSLHVVLLLLYLTMFNSIP